MPGRPQDKQTQEMGFRVKQAGSPRSDDYVNKHMLDVPADEKEFQQECGETSIPQPE